MTDQDRRERGVQILLRRLLLEIDEDLRAGAEAEVVALHPAQPAQRAA